MMDLFLKMIELNSELFRVKFGYWVRALSCLVAWNPAHGTCNLSTFDIQTRIIQTRK